MGLFNLYKLITMHPKLTEQDVTTPKEGLVCYLNSHWLCVDGDPKRAMFFGTSPQANTNEQIGHHLLKTNPIYDGLNLQVVHIPIAYVPNRHIEEFQR